MLRSTADYAGAVDQNIQSRKSPHTGLDAVGVTNVERDGTPGKDGSLPRRIDPGRGCSGNGNLRTQTGQRASDCRANAAGAAADQCHVAGKKIRAKTVRGHFADPLRNAATSA